MTLLCLLPSLDNMPPEFVFCYVDCRSTNSIGLVQIQSNGNQGVVYSTCNLNSVVYFALFIPGVDVCNIVCVGFAFVTFCHNTLVTFCPSFQSARHV